MVKKKYVLLGVLIVLIVPSVFPIQLLSNSRYFAEYSGHSTDVNGYITENTTWTLAGNPYTVVAEPATPELSIEGIVMPYWGPVLLIYPTPEPYFLYGINVTVANEGTAEAGRFNVSFSVHLEGEIMPEYGRKEAVEGLQQGANKILLFKWDPQDYGNYTLTIAADSDNDVVELDETNNAKIVWVIGTIRGDFDGDGDADYSDFLIFVADYLKRFTSPPYPTPDTDWDGDVDYDDFLTFATNYLTSILGTRGCMQNLYARAIAHQ